MPLTEQASTHPSAGREPNLSVGSPGPDGAAYLAAVVATSSDAIVSKSLDGTITSWNKSAERIFGIAPPRSSGRTSGC